MIQIENVVKEYPVSKSMFRAVDQVSLAIEEGKSFGIVGYSGAGKSTLLRLVNGLIQPTSGKILIDGVDITQLKKSELNRMRHHMGMVFQQFNLLASLTVFQNIELALKIASYPKSVRKVRVVEVLEMVGLVSKMHQYPKNLSGGEKQRVGIARAIANRPKYLLCDEMTSALDQKTALEIVSVLQEVRRKTNVTILFISHQLDIVRKVCDEIAVMSKGKVVEVAKTKDLFVSPKHPVTQDILGSVVNFDHYRGDGVWKLTYTQGASNHSVLSEAVLRYQVHTNILYAQSMEIGESSIGFLIIQITGARQKEALDYLRSQGILIQEFSKEGEKIWD